MEFLHQPEWHDFVEHLQALFGSRVVCLGLQGSYRRGEATPTSDLDVVLILDVLRMEDLRAYRRCVERSPLSDKLCGFVSGKAELLAWPRADLFQFYHDTQPLVGTLDWLRERIQPSDILEAVRVGAANLYHAVCHSYLFEDRQTNLPELYKSPFFILQAKTYRETGEYFSSRQVLWQHVSPADRKILEMCVDRKTLFSGPLSELALSDAYSQLLTWCQELLRWCELEKNG
ncbi:MAG: nucleotidyltransferase domain-containing protein [Planctomycetia bacterium]|nr:nucleotidyltransferase domain-containing protein [Planctomycetia bacterium]